MQFAAVEGLRTIAFPQGRGTCPLCGQPVLAKCGRINAWHWAHKAIEDCDSWSEGETHWHLDWKQQFPPEWCEVVIGNHRADIRTPKTIIELQHSPISPAEIVEREKFYKSIAWLIDGQQFNIEVRPRDGYVSFRWKHPRKSWWHAKAPLYVDLGDDQILKIRKLYSNLPCGGWGYLLSHDTFIDRYFPGRRSA